MIWSSSGIYRLFLRGETRADACPKLLKCARASATLLKLWYALAGLWAPSRAAIYDSTVVCAGKITLRFLSRLPVGSGFLYIGFFGFLPAKNVLVFIMAFPLKSAH